MKKKRAKKIRIPGVDDEDESQLIKRLKAPAKGGPITFNVGVALALLLCYVLVAFISVLTTPILLVILIPTMYILLRYVKLVREQHQS